LAEAFRSHGYPGAGAETQGQPLIRGDISVRNLAEFVCRSGDLYPPRSGRQVDAEEGIALQKTVQQRRLQTISGYQREMALATEFACAEEVRRLQGRADGVYSEQGGTVIEEFKGCGELPESADNVDMAQALIYAGLYASNNDLAEAAGLRVRVVYVHADTLQEACFEQTLSAAQAQAVLAFILLCYSVRVERHQQRATRRVQWAAALDFPMPRYRPSQQAIARRVYKALKQGQNLLLEAPTGSGKSLGVLFPAVKAVGMDEQLFYLTSRNAGAQAALTAVRQLDPDQQALSLVELTAKEKICPVEGMPCDASRCEYAAGYFDRVGAAVDAVIAKGCAERTVVQQIARAHTVCPFELSLDAALWADVVCGDYNYILDPVVKLQRFSGHRGLHLLIDEAHQLSPRARDMLAVSLPRRMLTLAKKTSHAAMAKRVASLDRALLALRRSHGDGVHHGVCPDAVARACSKFLEVAAEQELELETHPELVELYLAVWRWHRSDAWYQAEHFEHLLEVDGRNITLSRICLDPGPYLQTIFDDHGSVIRFSATVSPMALYQRLHGVKEESGDGCSERAGSPFSAEQALVLVVPDIPTYFKQREQSLPRLAALISQLVSAQPGRYLVALPSYAYLDALSERSETSWGDTFVQQRGLSPADSDALLQRFADSEHGVLFIVMGGIFGESVDFSAFSLKGTIMVGLGLPPPSAERKLIEAHFDRADGDGWGRMVAYTQPALVKNIQAAGRLIRSEQDYGIICLVDPRFTSPEVQRFFPAHWRPQLTRTTDVTRAITRFWQERQVNDQHDIRQQETKQRETQKETSNASP
jgi:Rad3-related DNA helicase